MNDECVGGIARNGLVQDAHVVDWARTGNDVLARTVRWIRRRDRRCRAGRSAVASEQHAVLRTVAKFPNLQGQTHAFTDVHEFRAWMGAPREEEEQNVATDDLLSGRVTIADVPVEHLGRHAGARRTCDLGHAYGARSAGEMRYGYCDSCDRILECERVAPPQDTFYDEDVWFPIEWNRRSRDGWIRARDERASVRVSLRLARYHHNGDFESEDHIEVDDDV